MADISITVDGIRFANPFILASGPPGTNGKVIQRSFELGWGGIVCKTISLDHTQVHNTVPRYAKWSDPDDRKKVLGFQNIELISDRPFDLWLDELTAAQRSLSRPGADRVDHGGVGRGQVDRNHRACPSHGHRCSRA